MANRLYREKSLKRIASPEELDGYIRVSNPSTWLVLSAVIILLVSFCIWGIFGRLETSVIAEGTVRGGEMEAVFSDPNGNKVKAGMTVYLKGEPVGVVEKTAAAQDGTTALVTTTNLPDGKYELSIVVESINPIAFIVN
jgi:hypothetical protein